MVDTNKTYDVFVSHSARDTALAMEVANACREVGIDAVTSGELSPTADTGDALREALAESRALLTILSPRGLTSEMAIEIGAARVWNKPIYAVVTDPSSARLPAALSGTRLYTPGQVQDVIWAIKSSVQQWTDDDRALLIKLYADMGTPADQLALDPRLLEDLMKRFERGSGKVMSGERLLSELQRLRKQGELVKHRPTSRVKAKDKPA